MSANLAFRNFDSLLVLRENDKAPEDAEWDACLDAVRSHKEHLARLRVLVRTPGGGPTGPQRARLAKVLGGVKLRIAVVTEKVAVRFIVSSVALFTAGIRSFSPDELDKAYAHLDLNQAERMLAARAYEEMGPLLE